VTHRKSAQLSLRTLGKSSILVPNSIKSSSSGAGISAPVVPRGNDIAPRKRSPRDVAELVMMDSGIAIAGGHINDLGDQPGIRSDLK
jgi:hypothetical protein